MALLNARENAEAVSSRSSLSVDVREAGPSALVVLAGEVDVSTVGELYERFRQLARKGICHVSLDLAEVTYMDSTGLSVLVTEQKRVQVTGGELVLFSPSARLRLLFEISGLESHFEVRPKAAPDHSVVNKLRPSLDGHAADRI